MKRNSFTPRLLLLLLLILCSLILLTACSTRGETAETDGQSGTAEEITEPDSDTSAVTEPDTLPPERETVDPRDVICLNPELVYTYTDEQYDALNKKIDRLYALLAAADPADKQTFLDLYKEVEEGDYETLMEQLMIQNVMGAVYVTDPDVTDRMVAVSERYNKVLQRMLEMYDDIDESPFGEAFFADWPQSERELAVRIAKTYTAEAAALRVAYDKLEADYNALPRDESFLEASAGIYLRAVEMNKQIAAGSGYDNFLDYAYEMIYERDYTPADVERVKQYVVQYLVPCLDKLYEKLMLTAQSLGSNMTDSLNYMKFNDAGIASLGVVPTLGKGDEVIRRTVSDYFNAVSPDMNKAFEELWAQNHFILTFNSSFSRAGAFTAYLREKEYPVIYLGPGYQGLYTVVHEYGHAWSMMRSGTSDIPMDLSEVQSQGDEWLFTAFLNGKITANAYRMTVLSKMFNDIASIVNCVAVNEFEAYVYAHDVTDADEYDRVFAGILRELGADKYLTTDYWHYVTVDNAGYYISYAVSLIPSITLYAKAQTDFGAAAQSYFSLTEVGEYDTFLDKLARAGISSPFDEQTYRDISGIIGELVR